MLGIKVSVGETGVRFEPEAAKKIKWRHKIQMALETGKLTGGEASKLAGALNWAGQKTFKRLGRAMFRPIYG